MQIYPCPYLKGAKREEEGLEKGLCFTGGEQMVRPIGPGHCILLQRRILFVEYIMLAEALQLFQ